MAELVSRRSIIYDINFDVKKGIKSVKQAETAVKKVDKQTSNFSDTLKKVGLALGVAFSVQQIAGFARELFKTALQLEAFERRAKVVFGKSLRIVEDFARGNARSLGLTQAQFKGAAAAIGDLLVPLGITRQRAAEMSTELVKLGGALQQFTGDQRSAGEISSIVARALTGEVEGLKQLGVTVSLNSKEFQELVKRKMADEGVTMLQARALAIYETAIQRANDALVAFENDTDSLTRQTQELTAQMTEFSEGIARSITPALLKGALSVNLFLKGFEELNDKIQEVEISGGSFGASVSDQIAGQLFPDFIKVIVGSIVELGQTAEDEAKRLQLLNDMLLAISKTLVAAPKPFIGPLLEDLPEDVEVSIETLTTLGKELKILQTEFVKTETNTPRFLELRDTAIPALIKKIKLLSTGVVRNTKAFKEWKKELDSAAIAIFNVNEELDKIQDKVRFEFSLVPEDGFVVPEENIREAEIQGLEELAQAHEDLASAKINAAQASVSVIRSATEEGSAISTALLVFEKGLAIADVIINLQKELSAHAAFAATLGLAGIPFLAAQTTAANLRAGFSIAAIAATVIPQFLSGGGGGSSSASAFAEGTEYLERGKNKKGKDTIPLWADEGEAIIPGASNKKYPGLARAFIDQDITNWVGANIEIPSFTNNVDIPANKDYTSSFYRQWRTTKDGHIGTKHMIGILSSIDRKLGTTPTRYV